MPTYKRTDLIRVGTRLLRKYRNVLEGLKPGTKVPGVEKRLAAWTLMSKNGWDLKPLTAEQATLVRDDMDEDLASSWDD